MALNYYSTTITKSNVTAAAATDSIDLRGFSQVAIHTIFATCTGTTNTQVDFKIQTSNDDSDWVDLKTIVDEGSNNAEDLNGDSYFDYLPDNATADEFGFGRYIRFYLTASGTFSVSYQVIIEAKE